MVSGKRITSTHERFKNKFPLLLFPHFSARHHRGSSQLEATGIRYRFPYERMNLYLDNVVFTHSHANSKAFFYRFSMKLGHHLESYFQIENKEKHKSSFQPVSFVFFPRIVNHQTVISWVLSINTIDKNDAAQGRCMTPSQKYISFCMVNSFLRIHWFVPTMQKKNDKFIQSRFRQLIVSRGKVGGNLLTKRINDRSFAIQNEILICWMCSSRLSMHEIITSLQCTEFLPFRNFSFCLDS